MINFNVPPCIDTAFDYMKECVANHKICGDGPFTKRCSEWMEQRFGAQKVLLTTSGTSALEMACRLAGLTPGDEAILPSYTFSSTADAVILCGATPVFVDIRPDTMNIDERKIEAAITPRTRALIVVHYAGVACDMDAIMDIAQRHNLKVIEDAAQGVMATYQGRALGTISDFGCYSFHETKNYAMGEGGALVIRDAQNNEPAEIMREKGTNRAKFFRGQIDKYTWVDYGSSYLPADLNAAYLWAQLEHADEINENRLATWNAYHEAFEPLERAGKVERPFVPEDCTHNAHLYYLKCADLAERTALISFLKEHGVQAVFHYVPLHSAPAGRTYGRFNGTDEFTTKESERLVRLPLYFGLSEEDRTTVIEAVRSFYNQGGQR